VPRLSGIPKSIVLRAELFLPIFYDAQLGRKEEVDPFILNESNPVQRPNEDQVPLDDKSVYMASWVRDKRPLTSLDDTRRHCSSQQSIKSGPCRFPCLDSCERTTVDEGRTSYRLLDVDSRLSRSMTPFNEPHTFI
jgi:hypothetical protein